MAKPKLSLRVMDIIAEGIVRGNGHSLTELNEEELIGVRTEAMSVVDHLYEKKYKIVQRHPKPKMTQPETLEEELTALIHEGDTEWETIISRES